MPKNFKVFELNFLNIEMLFNLGVLGKKFVPSEILSKKIVPSTRKTSKIETVTRLFFNF